MTTAPSPLDVATYVVGLVIALPTLYAAVRVIYFVAQANTKLETCVTGLDELKKGFSSFKHEMRGNVDEQEKRLMLVERDVEQLKESAA